MDERKSKWDIQQPFGENAIIRVQLSPDGWVEKLDILYGKPGSGERVGPKHGHLVMGSDGNTLYLRTLDGQVKVDKKSEEQSK